MPESTGRQARIITACGYIGFALALVLPLPLTVEVVVLVLSLAVAVLGHALAL